MTQTAADTSSTLEVELKFELTAQHVRKLSRAAAFKALWAEPPCNKALCATYYDTPDLKLARRDISLWVRRENRDYVQCCKVKVPGSVPDSLANREWQWLIPGPTPDLALLKSEEETRALLWDINLRKLQPLFTVDIKRQSRLLTTPGGAKVRCDIDQGRIVTSTREAPFFELELEPESASVSELLELARLVTSIVPARLSSRTKAQRGLELAQSGGVDGSDEGWVKAQPLALANDAMAHEVLCASVVEGLKLLIANEPCVLARRHIEGVHQMRVALRRMRSIITTYNKLLPKGCFEVLSRSLKAAGTALGPARDWDMFLNEILPAVEINFDDQQTLAVLRTKAEYSRAEAYCRADELIHSAEYARLLTNTLHWVGTTPWVQRGSNPLAVSAIGTAGIVLARHHTRLLMLGKGLGEMSIEELHLLRITIKKARYAAESFAPLYPKRRATIYIRRLRTLQDGLGHINDVATVQRLMAELSHNTRGKNAYALNHATGQVEGWYTHAQQARKDNLRRAWAAFSRSKGFW